MRGRTRIISMEVIVGTERMNILPKKQRVTKDRFKDILRNQRIHMIR